MVKMNEVSNNAMKGDSLDAETSPQYRCLIGRLLYLHISHPDISFGIHKLSQYVSKPCQQHLQAIHHLLRYLKGMVGQGILIQSTLHFQLKAFVDSDWGSYLDTRRSVTGFCVFLGESLILWKT